MERIKPGALQQLAYLAHAGYVSVRRGKMRREVGQVVQEYSEGWRQYEQYLDRCVQLDDWLRIRGFDDGARYYNVEGRLEFRDFDSSAYYRLRLLETLDAHFPDARSVTEYGSGLGRNLLFLKRARPHLQVYGYELCEPGVAIGTRAAHKYGLDVRYSQLDMVNAGSDRFVFPQTDVAFTMFVLEQLPESSDKALQSILSHTRLGSIHIEPVPENYPWTYRGLIGRLDHWKADYLQGFERVVRTLPLAGVSREVLSTSHNPLMFPTLYALKKVGGEAATS
jgi:hypothetical protein